jgi:16S rRNA U516 pseudouridylate synthase RsuA-like enzyme
MLKQLGHQIVQLDRAQYAGLTTENLPRGQWRRLSGGEVQALRERVNLS